ncbi:hypothetical protein HK100_001269 [Physocladia obscura]|uniref:FAD-binding FR-type domain-containing protein n=1 Tax=Physocladia obscura TaxID=109957 RepID=A0AAD5SY61_9FUNG|nr:hypothetical protein HK100_001269 [Physocladia obscura]
MHDAGRQRRDYVGHITLHAPQYAYVLPDNDTAAGALFGLVIGAMVVQGAVVPVLYRRVAGAAQSRRLNVRRLRVAVHWLAHVTLTPPVPFASRVPLVPASLAAAAPPLLLCAFLALLLCGADVSAAAYSDIGNQRLGSLCVALVAANFVAGLRNGPLLVLRVPVRTALQWHVWLGSAATALALAHGISYVLEWQYYDFVFQSLRLVRNQWGVGAAALILLMFLSSFWLVRRRAYLVFHTVHVLALPGLLAVLYFHAPDLAYPMFTPTVSLYLLDRAIRFFNSCTSARIVDMKVWPNSGSHPNSSTTMLTVCAPPICDAKGFRAGQYVYVKIPEVSMFKWHPLSFSNGPKGSKKRSSVCKFNLVHSGNGPFSRGLSKAVSARLLNRELPPPQIYVDGPYGNSPVSEYLDIFQHFVYVAGGIGATPALSMAIENVRCKRRQVSELSTSETYTLTFVWAVKHLGDLDWAMDELENLVGANNSKSPTVRVQVLLYVTAEESIDLFDSEIGEESRGEEAEGLNTGIYRKLAHAARGNIHGITVSHGRPDFHEIFHSIRNIESENGLSNTSDCGVVVSGPNSLVSSVRKIARIESDANCLYHVFTESFEM